MSKTSPAIRFQATLHRPKAEGKPVEWTFLNLPKEVSAKLASRGMVSVNGVFNGVPLAVTLNPDGRGGHWLKVEAKLREAAGAAIGGKVTLEIAPAKVEPEPEVPKELREALGAHPRAQELWAKITPLARRDWVQWIESAKREQTRFKRVEDACDMLTKGKRVPCCFDRSGMYSKSLSCPVPDDGE